MLYLSKGAILTAAPVDKITVHRCNADYTLTSEQSRIWLRGRFGVCEPTANDTAIVRELGDLGLIEADDVKDNSAIYHILTNCVLCKARLRPLRSILNKDESYIWTWIAKSGYMLSFHELVYLVEHQIKPELELLGKENWHTLVARIYSVETIYDGILMAKMECSPARDRTAKAVLGLLRKKRLIII